MFRTLENPPNPLIKFFLHSMLAGPVAVIMAGIVAAAFDMGTGADLTVAAVVGGGLAFAVNGKPRHRVGAFVWVVPFVLLLWGVVGSATSWDPRWAGMERWVYVQNEFLGPDCSSTECLAIVFSTMPAITSGTYSLVTFLVRWVARTTQDAASQKPADSATP